MRIARAAASAAASERVRPIAVIDVPSDLGLKPTGVAELPDALRSAGLLRGLPDVRDGGSVVVPAYDATRDTATGVLNPAGIRQVSRGLARHVERALAARQFPLVLGGDCSILLGVMLALRHRGRYGLLFLDGHADFYSPEAEPNGEVASMELALLTGHEPQLTGHEPQLLRDLYEPPLVREEDVVVFGMRDEQSAADYGSPDVRATRMTVLDCATVQQMGATAAQQMGATAAQHAVAHLESHDTDGFWIHLDADVLSDDVMPAVDYRIPGGLTPDELVDTLTAALRSERVVGMDITIYNPRLDDDERSAAKVLAGAVGAAFVTSR